MSETPMKEIRARLYAIADEYCDERIRELADLTKRHFGGRAPPQSREVTFELAQQIMDYKVSHPDLTLSKIGAKFNINQGRVSEILTG